MRKGEGANFNTSQNDTHKSMCFGVRPNQMKLYKINVTVTVEMRFKLIKASNICPRHFSKCPIYIGYVTNVRRNKGTSSEIATSWTTTHMHESECHIRNKHKAQSSWILLLNLYFCTNSYGLPIHKNHVLFMDAIVLLIGWSIEWMIQKCQYCECTVENHFGVR